MGQDIVEGLSAGSIYAALALAFVLVFRASNSINFAQGEMAMCSTFLAWALLRTGVPLGLAVLGAAAAAFVVGMALQRALVHPLRGRDPMAVGVVTLGLLLVLNSAAGWTWGVDPHGFPSLFPDGVVEVAGLRIGYSAIGNVGVLLAIIGLLYLLFEHTRSGLALRAAASNPDSSRLSGIPVTRVLMIGWGLAGALGAVAGALVAPTLFLSPNMMESVLIYALAAAALGGMDSAIGAIVGGWVIGVSESLASSNLSFIGADLKLLVPLAIIFAVLLVRPSGLFGSREVTRV
jgi:branched-chain amino acid transport system permease protein